jgi:NAD(P)-dependent dehydrogenase (short-subunit alcohol dehydrogenase family)
MTSTIGSNIRPGQPLAVVVGAGGLSMAIARRLGDSHRILIADLNEEHLDRQVRDLRAEGHDALAVGCDVTDETAVRKLAAAANDAGPVRVLAHVVGLSPSMADAATILRVNLLGPTLVATEFLALAGPGAAAVFIASLAGHRDTPSEALTAVLDDPLASDWVARVRATHNGEVTSRAAYQLAKFGVIRMCQRDAARWGQRGARIVSLSPGLINSPQGAGGYDAHPEKYGLVESTPLGREGTMIEIADAVEFLTSDRASFISGIDLLVDGGLLAATRYPTGTGQPSRSPGNPIVKAR